MKKQLQTPYCRLAFLRRIREIALRIVLLAVLYGGAGLALPTESASAGSDVAALRLQNEVGRSFLALTPIDAATAALQTHTADIRLVQNDAGSMSAAVDALYRVRNEDADTVTLLVRLTPQTPGGEWQPEQIGLEANGQAVALLPGDNESFTAQIPLPGDARVDLRLRYRADLGAGPLVTIAYDLQHISEWSGDRSLRAAMELPAEVPPASWLRILPAGWRYLVGDANGVQWLFDGSLPGSPLQLQFIHPQTWTQIQTAEQAAAPGASAAAFQALGDLYADLFAAAGTDRFYAQALAAYAAGLAAAGDASDAGAPLHAALAALYRTRVVGPDGRTDLTYVDLMVDAAQAAAEGLQATDPRWSEMMRWRQEGLNLQLIAARRQRDWPGALALLESMAALPDQFVDDATLAAQRRDVELQQGLQLLSQGDRNAALALAGPQIADAQLTPPETSLSLFAAWHVTVTAGVDGTQLLMLAEPAPGADDRAYAALTQQLARWEDAGLPRGVQAQVARAVASEGTNRARLTLTLPPNDDGAMLASLTAGGPQLAMLRSLLEQATTLIERRQRLFWEEVTLQRTLNLAPVGDQWRAMAADLRRQAAAFETQAAAFAEDSAGAEEALRAQIQATAYRAAAADWERLAQKSWAVTTLQAPSRLESLSRSWMTPVGASGQTMVYRVMTPNPTRLLLLALASIGVLLLASALLWRLL